MEFIVARGADNDGSHDFWGKKPKSTIFPGLYPGGYEGGFDVLKASWLPWECV